jgi:hypothetical protein
MKLDSLPTQYIPFKEIRLGSNILENVAVILTIKGNVPLLVGNGDTPRVWLYIPADREGTEWYPLIKDNFSSNPDVKVNVAPKMISIRTPEGTVFAGLVAEEDKFFITKLDLRPFGLKVYADENSLSVMGNTLAKNQFRNLRVVIGID